MSSITNIAISELIVATIFFSTVWLYLCALPFQLVDLFGWYTIPGVGIASFIYLGFIATGEEIEQPFGYDEVRIIGAVNVLAIDCISFRMI